MKIILIISLTLLAIAGACGEFEKDKKIAELEKKIEQSENILTETESETSLKEIDIIRVPKTWDTPEEQGEYLFTSYGAAVAIQSMRNNQRLLGQAYGSFTREPIQRLRDCQRKCI